VRWGDVFIAGAGSWFPPRRPVEEAVEAGVVQRARAEILGVTHLPVAEHEHPPEMAVAAGLDAIDDAGIDPTCIDVVLHASVWFQGHDMWTPAAYIGSRTAGPSAVTFDVDQRSNGGLGTLHLAAAHVRAASRPAWVLVTTADRFAGPHIDRWHTEPQCVLGDGASALVVTNQPAKCRLRSSAFRSDTSFEWLGRGSSPFSDGPALRRPAPGLDRYQAAMELRPEADFDVLSEHVRAVLSEALDDADAALDDLAKVSLPFMQRGGGQEEMFDMIGVERERTTWDDLGRVTGHLGAGDQAAGLDHLLRTGQIGPGDLVLLIAAGVGYTFSAAVVECC